MNEVADVRSHPASRFNPQFNRAKLEGSLAGAGIAYAFLGRELGARSEDPDVYVEGCVDYNRLARTRSFQDGLALVSEHAIERRVALMCAEREPLVCHRAILVCRHLAERGFGVQHILGGGGLESHDAALARLLAELGAAADLFRDRGEVQAEAYRLRGEQIAFCKDPKPKVSP